MPQSLLKMSKRVALTPRWAAEGVMVPQCLVRCPGRHKVAVQPAVGGLNSKKTKWCPALKTERPSYSPPHLLHWIIETPRTTFKPMDALKPSAESCKITIKPAAVSFMKRLDVPHRHLEGISSSASLPVRPMPSEPQRFLISSPELRDRTMTPDHRGDWL